jgi:hypothetical protein
MTALSRRDALRAGVLTTAVSDYADVVPPTPAEIAEALSQFSRPRDSSPSPSTAGPPRWRSTRSVGRSQAVTSTLTEGCRLRPRREAS